MATFGINPEHTIGDGVLRRFAVNGKNKNGWAVLFMDADCAGGAFGNWSQGIDEKWSSFSKTDSDPAKLAAFMEKIEESKRLAEEERKEKAQRAAQEAEQLWTNSIPINPGHPYLIKKQISGISIRQEKGTNNLLVPMYAAGMKLVGIQRISEDGTKRFNPGCAKKGSSSIIKGQYNDRIYVCEGYATAETIYMATGRTVFVAFDSGNLLPVCTQIRSKTKAPIIICGDDDIWTVRTDGTPYNAGRINGAKCQEKLGCITIFPTFINTAAKPSDFNDLMCLEGIGRVKAIASDPWDDRRTQVYKKVKEWATSSSGKFSTVDVDRELGIIQVDDKRTRDEALKELLMAGTLEQDDVLRGTYRTRDCNVNILDINAYIEDDLVEFWLPFELFCSVRLSPKNIVMIAGENNAGKTTFAIEMLKENLEMYSNSDKKFFYITSEMGAAELKSTLTRFGTLKDFERCTFIDRQFEPYDLIKNNKDMQDGFVFIDFLETRSGDYSKTVAEVQKIYDALGDGIAVVLVQKQPGKEHAKGGSGMLEKPRFALNLEKRFKSDIGNICIAHIAKCKSVHYGEKNPDGQSVYYLVNAKGSVAITSWSYLSSKAKDTMDISMKSKFGIKEHMCPVINNDAIEEAMR
jgi:putative DNA primase/helicase